MGTVSEWLHPEAFRPLFDVFRDDPDPILLSSDAAFHSNAATGPLSSPCSLPAPNQEHRPSNYGQEHCPLNNAQDQQCPDGHAHDHVEWNNKQDQLDTGNDWNPFLEDEWCGMQSLSFFDARSHDPSSLMSDCWYRWVDSMWSTADGQSLTVDSRARNLQEFSSRQHCIRQRRNSQTCSDGERNIGSLEKPIAFERSDDVSSLAFGVDPKFQLAELANEDKRSMAKKKSTESMKQSRLPLRNKSNIILSNRNNAADSKDKVQQKNDAPACSPVFRRVHPCLFIFD